MASRSDLSYEQRAKDHPNPLVKRLFHIAREKKTNIVLSADLTTTEELLSLADSKFLLRPNVGSHFSEYLSMCQTKAMK